MRLGPNNFLASVEYQLNGGRPFCFASGLEGKRFETTESTFSFEESISEDVTFDANDCISIIALLSVFSDDLFLCFNSVSSTSYKDALSFIHFVDPEGGRCTDDVSNDVWLFLRQRRLEHCLISGVLFFLLLAPVPTHLS